LSFDLRSKYAFDASEAQMPEGRVSPYGMANATANCVPASFTAALDLAGFGDIDPQRVTNELYGPNYRGGYGNFDRMLGWIAQNIPSAPSWTHSGFDFAAAEEAGRLGRLIIVAGRIDPASVTFVPYDTGWTHASLLIAHNPDDSFVIWNTWSGQIQTYSRAVLAASFYEMAIFNTEVDMQPALLAFIEIIGLTGNIPPAGGGEQWLTDIINQHNPDEVGSQIGELLKRPEVKAYLARQAWLRENLIYDPATNKATLKSGLKGEKGDKGDTPTTGIIPGPITVKF
jgi:hypothetical protein